MALALLDAYKSDLEKSYQELISDRKDKIILTGKAGIDDLTWVAKKSSARAIVDGKYDFTILWDLTHIGIDDIDERLACKLSALSPPDEWEFDNTRKDNTEKDKQKQMSKLFEGKNVLLIFVDEASEMTEEGKEHIRKRMVKAKSIREILITRAPDKVYAQDLGGKTVTVQEEPKIKEHQTDDQESLSSCCQRIWKAIKKFPGLQRPETVDESEPQLVSDQSKLLLESILIDFCCHENKFPFQHGSVHYRELITYWILEGYLGPFDCFDNAYEKGHRILVALADQGFIEKLQEGYVRKKGKKLNLSARDHCGMEETVHLGLATAFGGKELGRIAHADGIVRTLGKAEEGKKSSTLLIDGNSLSREVPDDLFESRSKIEALAIFNPISEPDLLSHEMLNLRLLVLRGCDFLGSLENLLKPGSTVADNTSYQKLSVLEISGPSPSITISNNLFEPMTHIQILNLSSLQIASLPSSLYQLPKLIRLILRGCSKLKEIGSLKSMTELQVLDLSGATSLVEFHDKSFSNLKLQVLNLSNTKIKKLPLINGLKDLTYLLLRDCKSLSRLRMIGSLSSLKILDLSGSRKFVEFPDQSLESLGSLEEINVSQTQIEKLPSDICSIRRLSLRECSKFKEFPVLKNPSCLELLDLSSTNLIRVPSISNLSKLKELFLSGCNALPDYSFENMHDLEKLELFGTKIEYLPSLSHLSKLRHLFLQKCTNLKVLPSLESLTNLEELSLSGFECEGDVDLDFLKNMVNLHLLDISETKVTQLPSLSNLKKLKHLYLRGCKELTEVPSLDTMLEVLDLSGSGVVNLPSFENFHNLRCLLLRDCPKIEEFKDLEISEVLKGSTEKLPCSISQLKCLNHLELPKMNSGENEELLPWRISSWPLGAVSSSHMLGIFMDNFELLQFLEKSSTVGGSFHFLVHPIEEETNCCSHSKKQTSVGHPIEEQIDSGGKYHYQNELFQRETFFRTRKLCQCKEQGRDCQCRKLMRSLEIRGFSKYPPGIERLVAQAKFLFLIDNQFIKSLSSLDAKSIKEIKYCWIERCSKMESILSGEEVNTTDNSRRNKDQGNTEEIVEVSTEIGHSLEILRVSDAISLKNIYSGNLQGQGLSFLKFLYLEHCPELASCSSSRFMVNLQILQIKFCDKFTTLFDTEDKEPALPNLHTLCLWALPALENIACKVESLQTLDVGECPKLESVNSSILHSKKLEILHISFCDSLKTVVADNTLELPKSLEVHLQDLPELREIVNAPVLPPPGKMIITGCPNYRLPQ